MIRRFDLTFGPGGPLCGTLGADDPSLTFDATAREVRRWPDGVVVGDDVFTVLGEEIAGDPGGLWVGWFGYACRSDLPARPADHGVPDAVWMRVPSGVERTPGAGRSARGSLQRRAPQPNRQEPPAGQHPPPWYDEAFAEVQRRLCAGDSYEVNLTMRESLEVLAHPEEVARRLLERAPGAPYAGLVRHDDTWLLSASPETFVRIDGQTIETRPIKGTTPRSDDPVADAGAAEALRTAQRFRAENLIITDLSRNDLAIVCEPGSVVVPQLMEVEQHAAVHQLVTTVRGRLRPEVSVIEAVHALFPAGSMTGAPKRRTMEIIDEVETSPRGAYAGAYGWISGDGRADLAVVIRSLVRAPGGTWLLGTGGGITVHSDVAGEWQEAGAKVVRLREALGL